MSENSDVGERPADLYFRAIDSVEQDNKDEFVSLMNRLSSIDEKIVKTCQEGVIGCIPLDDSANCLAAVLDGLVGDSLITYYLSDVGKNMPLHYAARTPNPRIASLLLDRGFSADLRTDFDSRYVRLNNALPLNVSLDDSRYCLWSSHSRKSPTHQIIELCRWRKSHKTIRVIARNTAEIKHEFFKYLKQGQVVEVGALLAIASDLIMSSPSTIDGENGSIGFKNIMEMRQFLLAEISRSLGASDTQLKEMNKTLRLLEIFDRVGDKLVAHMPMWDDSTSEDRGIKVASLIKDAAYDEKAEVEYDHDAVPRAYYTPKPYPHCEPHLPHAVKITTSYFNDANLDYSKRKFSTKIHFPSGLEEGRSHVDVPLLLPTTLKGAVTKHVLSKKHASFTRALAKAVRLLRYR